MLYNTKSFPSRSLVACGLLCFVRYFFLPFISSNVYVILKGSSDSILRPEVPTYGRNNLGTDEIDHFFLFIHGVWLSAEEWTEYHNIIVQHYDFPY